LNGSGGISGITSLSSATLTATTSLTIGATTISESEIGVLDGVSAGTAANSKALVLNGSGGISGITSLSSATLTATTSLTIGATTISESEIGVLDGVSAGTAANSKALVLSSGGAISGITSLSTATLTATGLTTLAALTATGAITLGSAVTTGGASILNTTPSTTTGTGALVVAGGAGIGGAMNVGGALNVGGAITVNGQPISSGSLSSFRSAQTIANMKIDNAWVGTTSATETNTWTSVCWSPELRLLVAVASNGLVGNQIMTSTNGTTWVSQTSPAANPWTSVCWSPELRLFVAVASSGTSQAMTSPDGITWTARTTSSGMWTSVCWSPDLLLFVAVSQGGTYNAMSSPDGITWTARTASSVTWISVCWSSELDLFVAVANTGTNRIMYSSTGITWTSGPTTGDANGWMSVCWSPELRLFVAVASVGTNRVMYSSNGVSWTLGPTTGDANGWYNVCWSPDVRMFVAVATTGSNKTMTSSDGITWTTKVSSSETNSWNAVCWSPALREFVAVGSGTSNCVMTYTIPSNDPVNVVAPTAVTNGLSTNSISSTSQALSPAIASSQWTLRRSANEANLWSSMCWSPELRLFVAVAVTGANRIMYSPDGINWTLGPTTGDANNWRSVCWSPKLRLFVAVANGGTNRVMYSSNGTTWTLVASATETNEWRSVCWSPELRLFLAVASTGTNLVMYSSDGITWTSVTTNSNEWRSVCWSPEMRLFVAVAITGTNRIMYSSNGTTWTVGPTTGNANQWYAVCWSPELSMFVAVAGSGANRIMYSSDGVNWTLGPTTLDAIALQNICWSPEMRLFVAVADVGTCRICYSSDGINWTIGPSTGNANQWYAVCWSPELRLFAATASAGTNRVMTLSGTSTTASNTLTITAPTKIANELIVNRIDTVDKPVLDYGWKLGPTTGDANVWASVCWSPERRLFVAVAYAGTNRVMYSSDGTTWALTTSAGETNAWNAVCWSPELRLFVAVAYAGTNRVMYSSNGTTWTAATSADETNAWASVCWSPELRLFVAVASGGTKRIMYSSNGTTWSSATSAAASNPWYSVCWSPELRLFVAVAYAGTNRVMYSSNGTTWTAATSAGETNEWVSVCWSPELRLFVAIANAGTNRVMYSSNGTTWTSATSADEFSTWKIVCWSPELRLFVAVAGTGSTMYSSDGVNWQLLPYVSTNWWQGACWSPELRLFAAVAYAGTNNRVMSLQAVKNDTLTIAAPTAITNGLTTNAISSIKQPKTTAGREWTLGPMTAVNGWYSICWSPELRLFVAVAYIGTNCVTYSSNGTTWASVPSANDGNAWRSICWSPELRLFVAVASTGTNRVMYSSNGINWTAGPTTGDANNWYSVCWSPELRLFVAVANGGTNRTMYSSDGITWTLAASATETNGWNAVCWSPELRLFVAIAYSGTNRVMYSSTGKAWTPATSATETNGWNAVCWSPELRLFVAIAASGTNRIMYSSNGINWTTGPTTGDATTWYSVCWSPEMRLFVACGASNYSVMYSLDGKTWSIGLQLGGGTGWYGICWSPELNLFAAVGQNGYTMTSGGFISDLSIEASSVSIIDTTDSTAIGTGALVVAGGASIGGSTTLAGAIKLGSVASTDSAIIQYYPNSTSASRYMSIGTNTYPSILNIRNNGCLGIGTSTPSFPLDVVGNGRITKNMFSQQLSIGGSTITINPSSSASGAMSVDAITCYSDNTGVLGQFGHVWINGPVLGGTNAQTNQASTLNIAGPPITTDSHGIYDSYSLCVNDGISFFGDQLRLSSSTNAYTAVLPTQKRTVYDSSNNYPWGGSGVTGHNIAWSPTLGFYLAIVNSSAWKSFDGVNWYTHTATGLQATCNCLYWIDELSKFVLGYDATGTYASGLAYSSDGATWTVPSGPSSASTLCYVKSMAWSGSYLYVVYNYGTSTLTNTKIVTYFNNFNIYTTYTLSSGTTTKPSIAITKSGVAVVVHESATVPIRTTSTPWINSWSAATTQPLTANPWSSICYSPELSLFVAVSSTAGVAAAAYSSDITTWTSSTGSNTSYGMASVIWAKAFKLFIATCSNGFLQTSPDGNIWTLIGISGTNMYTHAYASNISQYIAITDNYGYEYSPPTCDITTDPSTGALNIYNSANIRGSLSLLPSNANIVNFDVANVLWYTPTSRGYSSRLINSQNISLLSYSAGGSYNDYVWWAHNGGNPRLLVIGQLGVNNADPQCQLHVGSTNNSTAWGIISRWENYAGSVRCDMQMTNAAAAFGASTSHNFGIMTNNTIRMTFTSNTNAITVYQTITVSSDYRLKADIKELPYGLTDLLQLRPVTYKMKQDNKQTLGFIAHEMMDVIPEIVTGAKDEVDDEGKPVYQGIQYGELITVAVKAIQEQQTEIETLKSEVSTLKDQLAQLLDLISTN